MRKVIELQPQGKTQHTKIGIDSIRS